MQKYLLKAVRGIFIKANLSSAIHGRNWTIYSNKEYSNELIYQYLVRDEPCMIARFGSTEMLCLVNYLGIKQRNKNWISFIKGRSNSWWWERDVVKQMQLWSGFFPSKIEYLEQFCELMLNDIPQVDILGSWLLQENYFKNELSNAKRVVLEDLEPFFSISPWTKALEGKKVLVVHPFSETIEEQYKNRNSIFENNFLPQFELRTIRAVQSVAGAKTEFNDWFEALEYMKCQIDNIDYDICIIGCGAYGFPLAAHVKRRGKKALHLAGVTQLLFGIKGKRWEEYIVWPYSNLFNEFWVRPKETERPKNATFVENACYW